MKELSVARLDIMPEKINGKELSASMDTLTRHSLDHVPWPDYPYKPAVQFSIAHNGDHIFLKYVVNEKSTRAVNSIINSPVWEDSCVEFFLGFDEEGYYNFEFNCMGTPLVGFGKDKTDRVLLPEDIIRKIGIYSNQGKTTDLVHWELIISIPVPVFIRHSHHSLNGLRCRANFYKCGDLLPDPHFVTWASITSSKPDFHLPAYFGHIRFE